MVIGPAIFILSTPSAPRKSHSDCFGFLFGTFFLLLVLVLDIVQEIRGLAFVWLGEK